MKNMRKLALATGMVVTTVALLTTWWATPGNEVDPIGDRASAPARGVAAPALTGLAEVLDLETREETPVLLTLLGCDGSPVTGARVRVLGERDEALRQLDLAGGSLALGSPGLYYVEVHPSDDHVPTSFCRPLQGTVVVEVESSGAVSIACDTLDGGRGPLLLGVVPSEVGRRRPPVSTLLEEERRMNRFHQRRAELVARGAEGLPDLQVHYRRGVLGVPEVQWRSLGEAGRCAFDEDAGCYVARHVPVGDTCAAVCFSNGVTVWDPEAPEGPGFAYSGPLQVTHGGSLHVGLTLYSTVLFGLLAVEDPTAVERVRIRLLRKTPDRFSFTEQVQYRPTINSDLSFEFQDVAAGRYFICAEWEEGDTHYIASAPVDVRRGEFHDCGVVVPGSCSLELHTGFQDSSGQVVDPSFVLSEDAPTENLLVRYVPSHSELEQGCPRWYSLQVPIDFGVTTRLVGLTPGKWALSLERGFRGMDLGGFELVSQRPWDEVKLAGEGLIASSDLIYRVR